MRANKPIHAADGPYRNCPSRKLAMKKKLLALLMTVFVLQSNAWAGSGWVSVTIADFGAWQEDGGEYFLSIDRMVNPEGCSHNVAQLRWAENTPGAKAMSST